MARSLAILSPLFQPNQYLLRIYYQTFRTFPKKITEFAIASDPTLS